MDRPRMLLLPLSPLAVALLGLTLGPTPGHPLPPVATTSIRVDPLGDPLPPGALVRYGTARLRHLASSVVWLPDGKTLVSAWQEISLWDAATGKLLRSVPLYSPSRSTPGLSEYCNALALAPDGRTLVTGNNGNLIRLWDTATLRELPQSPGTTDNPGPQSGPARQASQSPPQQMAFTPDGRLLATLNNSDFGMGPITYADVFVWDVATAKVRHRLTAPSGSSATGFALAPDGHTLAAAADKVYFWDVATGRLRRTWDKAARNLAYSPDGKRLALVSADQPVRLYDADTGRVVWESGEGERPEKVVRFSPDGRLLLTAGSMPGIRGSGNPLARTLVVRDAATGRPVPNRAKPTLVTDLAFSPDGRTLAASADGRLYLWDAATGADRLPLPGPRAYINSLVVTPDGRTAVSTGGFDRTVRLWDVATGQERQRFEAPANPGGMYCTVQVAMSPDGRWAAFSGEDNAIHLLDPGTGQELLTLQDWSTLGKQLTFTPDGKALAAVDQTGYRLWDCTTGAKLAAGQHQFLNSQRSVLNTADGRLLVAGSDPGAEQSPYRVWDLRSERIVCELDGLSSGHVSSPGWSRDGRTLLVKLHQEESIHLYETATGRRRATIRPDGEGVYFLALAPDERTLAVAEGSNGTIGIWDVPTGRLLTRLAGHSRQVTAAAFTDDGRRLLTAGVDATALVWDATAWPRPTRSGPLSDVGLRDHWQALASADAAAAFRALWALADAPAQAVPFLREQLLHPPAIDDRQLRQWLTDLDSPRAADRDRATRELVAHLEKTEPLLRALLARQPSPEARRRAERILAVLEKGPVPPQRLRELRAVEALERARTAEARTALRDLSALADRPGLAREARAALARLCAVPKD